MVWVRIFVVSATPVSLLWFLLALCSESQFPLEYSSCCCGSPLSEPTAFIRSWGCSCFYCVALAKKRCFLFSLWSLLGALIWMLLSNDLLRVLWICCLFPLIAVMWRLWRIFSEPMTLTLDATFCWVVELGWCWCIARLLLLKVLGLIVLCCCCLGQAGLELGSEDCYAILVFSKIVGDTVWHWSLCCLQLLAGGWWLVERQASLLHWCSLIPREE